MALKHTVQPLGSDGSYQRSKSVCTLADRDFLLNQNTVTTRPRGFWRRKYQRFFPERRAARTPGPEERRKSQGWWNTIATDPEQRNRKTIAIEHPADNFPSTVVTMRGTGNTMNRLTISGPMPIQQSAEEKAEADAIKLECRGMMRRSTQRQAMSMIWV